MKRCLGDSVYAEWDGGQIKLTTEGNVALTSTIYLDIGSLKNLFDFYEKIRALKKNLDDSYLELDLDENGKNR